MLRIRLAAAAGLLSLFVASTASAQQQPPPEGYQQPPAQQAPAGYQQQPPPAPPPQAGYAQQPPPPPAAPAEGHERRAPNTVYGEGLGAGLWYSINYERLVHPDVAVRLGFSYVSLSASASSGGTTAESSASYLTFPLTVSYLGLGGDHHMFEVGGGVSINYASGSASGGVSSASGSGVTPFGVLFAGYRIHPVDGAGFNFRVGLMALAAQGLGLSDPDPESVGVLPWFYISFGASF